MTKRVVQLPRSKEFGMLLDIVSYGRGGGSGRFTKEQLELIARTVSRTPEVMVKVSGGARSLRGAAAHFGYISRQASLDLETDEGGVVRDKDGLKGLIRDWDLDIEVITPSARGIKKPAKGPKLVHNLIFSMPSGTPAEKVLKAVRKLAQEEWALKHRYAMVLHTDEPHPHVHVVLKARSEQGHRLNIRKATLRDWRQRFAAHLRDLGVPANATERVVRGQSRPSLPDAIFRARERGAQRSMGRPAPLLLGGRERRMQNSQKAWSEISFKLAEAGYEELAFKTHRFAESIQKRQLDRKYNNHAELTADELHRAGEPPNVRESA